MFMKSDLKIIKKLYGEQMAHFCRDNFSTILETNGLLLNLLLNNFEPSHNLYIDIIDQDLEYEFKNYIYSLVNIENIKTINKNKTPRELLNEIGYDLFECHSEEDIQKFKKYYAPGEELCTFNGGRLDRCYVFFAVKKDAFEIKREDYQTPKRQDKYGTSVISIQFTKDKSHTLSIKNRYNHIVNNPDATFSNNLDNIIPGLTESFANEYSLVQEHINNGFEIEGYVRANDGKYYKYNYEIDNIYYCPNNIIIDNFTVKRYDKEKYIVFDYFILDLVNKKIILYDKKIKDSFIETVQDIEKVEVLREEIGKNIKLTLKNGNYINILLNENNKIIKLENLKVEQIGDYFLKYNNTLLELIMPNLIKVGNEFFFCNKNLRKIILPNLEEIGSDFFYFNNTLKELFLPNLKKVKNNFFYFNNSFKIINLPNLRKVGNRFLFHNNSIQEINLINLEETGDGFLFNNRVLQIINLSQLQKFGYDFLNNCTMRNLIRNRIRK